MAPPIDQRFPCEECGAELDFHPGIGALRCAHCSHENKVPEFAAPIEEIDYESMLEALEANEKTEEVLTVKCDNCAAETTLPENVTAAECPYCGTNLVSVRRARSLIKPRSLLPFKLAAPEAQARFRSWIGGLWFAPNELKRFARTDHRLTGLYVPYWTYDSDTESAYTGMRGDDYWVTQTYTATENGRTVTRTRQVRKTRWRWVSGNVARRFDDILILASTNLPRKFVEKLEPWDLKALVGYQDEYLSGFRAQSYQVGLKEGFAQARSVMERVIRDDVCRDIGGDHQRIHSLQTRYEAVTFKHILLPVWLSAYQYRKRTFRFLVNARTGEVKGERPLSWAKIVLLALALVAAAIGIWLIVQMAS